MSRIAVIGAGIAGLSAAHRLLCSDAGHEVVIFEQTARVGGKLRLADVAGHRIDVGAESVLARRPEAVGLIRELRLPEVNPARVDAQLWSRGRLEPLPSGTFMGVPAEAASLSGVLNPEEVARAAAERPVQVSGDVSVGELVGSAFGHAVVDRLVEPLLGGVYAGQADNLSAAACLPQLYDVARQGGLLRDAVSRMIPPAATTSPQERPPVFASVRGGIGRLPEALTERLVSGGVDVRLGVTVHGLIPDGDGWLVCHGGVRDEDRERLDGVIVAAPAPAAAKLLRGVDELAAERLSRVEYASMVLVTYAFRASAMPELHGSGFLVPPVDGRTIKASTFTSVKWPWVRQEAPDLVFVRVSLGRHGEAQTLQRPDSELAAAGLADLTDALGSELPPPVDIHVQRWGGGLPQYAVGHLDLVDAVRGALANRPTIQLAGAAYAGVGIPACIASGTRAADTLLNHLTEESKEAAR